MKNIKEFVLGFIAGISGKKLPKPTDKLPWPVCAEVQYLCDELAISDHWTFPDGDLDTVQHVSGVKLSFVSTHVRCVLLDGNKLMLNSTEHDKLVDAALSNKDRCIAKIVEANKARTALYVKSSIEHMKKYNKAGAP